MKVTIKFTHTQYKEVGISLRKMLNQINENQDMYRDIEAICLIDGLEHIIMKIINKLMQPVAKKYTLTLNNFEAWVFSTACMDYVPNEYESVLINDVLMAILNESRRLLDRRKNLKGNLEMKQIN